MRQQLHIGNHLEVTLSGENTSVVATCNREMHCGTYMKFDGTGRSEMEDTYIY